MSPNKSPSPRLLKKNIDSSGEVLSEAGNLFSYGDKLQTFLLQPVLPETRLLQQIPLVSMSVSCLSVSINFRRPAPRTKTQLKAAPDARTC